MPLPNFSRLRFRRHFHRMLLSILIAFSLPSLAHATQYVSVGVGDFDILRPYADSADFLGEWRGNPFFNHFLPAAGFEINADGGKYGFAGINYDWEFLPNWIATPSAAVGAWSRGESARLGGTVEFREGLELDYRLPDNIRIGGRFTHMSNADIYDHNPGAETVTAIVSIPFGN